ncbi:MULTISPECIES: pilus (MSHA type) biogenesis protein MshL [unclassified Rhizobacter]|uniref:pilus (MSHA type) biogenesis protein MshL n=1 Tax=unclassified Rhizobacter TaxID=2640088 RepID=UPI0009E759E8|nr:MULTISPECIES: pilus (MSHA type) biogenesis protein MshL [unclassified Rhizobacter]
MNPIQAVRRPGRPGPRWMSSLCAALLPALGLVGCADQPLRTASPNAHLQAELAAALAQRPPSVPVSTPDTAPAPAPAPKPVAPTPPSEARFDLILNGAQVRDVFLSLVTDSRYSMLMHPDVGGTISATLKGVTMREALESLREVYGYDYKIDGRRVTVFPPTLQTRIFMVNYLHTQRSGRSDTRISSGASSGGDNGSSNNTGSNGSTASNGSRSRGSDSDGSQVSTSSKSDFWAETTEALRAMVGTTAGRNVIASPQSGTIAVRAMPDELRQVDAFLRSTRASVERQVMLEAKIIEVELRDGFQNGIDWSVLRNRFSIGQSSGAAGNALTGNANGLPTLSSGTSALADAIGLPVSGSGATGLAIASGGFQSILGFLETHGDMQILSSPRVATLNNQKAVLKVGTDDYFVTNVSGGSITTGTSTSTGTTTLPTLTLTAFFSGIALDVTPQIDEAGMVTLHVHPSVTSVVEKTKQIDLGTIGTYKLPLASSSVNETDTVVRIPDGAIVAIGGLMQMASSRQNSGLPGASGNVVTGTLFNNRVNAGRKRELVVLIKPTIIRGPDDWQRLTEQSRASLDEIEGQRRVITLDGSAKKMAAR